MHYPENQTCCGQPAFNAGFHDEAAAVAGKFLNDFGEDYLVVMPSASCAGFVKNYIPQVFKDGAKTTTAREVGQRTFEFSYFLNKVLNVSSFGANFQTRAVYHDSCAGLRECGIKQEPRELLKYVEGLTLIEMEDVETCCGFGGTFAVKFGAISNAMAEQKIQNALNANAETIISTDLSCLMHLQGVIDKKKLPLTTMHIADVLASGW